MPDLKSLGKMLSAIEDAELRFTRKTAHTFDDATIAAATKEYNVVLERAAHAILEDLGHPDDEELLMLKWRPTPLCDTWFGPEPANFLRHAVQTGMIQRDEYPDSSALH